ncbi:TPA: ribonuclease R [Streptococcus equi subsp. zooepidemicus]|uniref:ribonuclease R n=1 Tax=Streptococcus equi TaxID=1336 RepID=UPI001E62CD4D|nr:ribonuclease R [Streptococcus equi]MCD3423417.1 ribonuclease R [Streptococcus equi subsp. zooepidemicus]HEL0026379.1 ribonuclease R [Streptococcus equi subsp. zooepidemicus]HEL0733947.1 ribonuclease R [Streptococcus equi subsp. zooepidemicus]HEL1058152.1 ribonuclease R [Streptococcus equi subsp. zooepidemicus]HEL1102717.1 ribonuclease R [Streptococcus equi subsp. zooepidemicus]
MMIENITNYLKEHGQSNIHDLAAALEMTDARSFPRLIKAISKMEGKGLLSFSDEGEVFLRAPQQKKPEIRIQGIFRANKAGFGFLSVDDSEDDIFIGRDDVGYASDGDRVEAVIKKPANRLKAAAAEARVVAIVERSLKTVVGRVILDDDHPKYAGYIKSKNQRIQQRIYIAKSPIALDGTEIIKADIVQYPKAGQDYFVGSLRDIVGHQDDVGIDVLEVLESMDIVSAFPDDVLAEANAIPDAPSDQDLMGRVDLRKETTITIDGADAKDLDDAIHIKRLANGNVELGVHIADVSYYVTEGSALDREAAARGTSVYVTDRVVPMLPERLSNGICSLNPKVDRLTQSAIMEIDQQGHVVDYQLCQSVINTTFRMTYSAVNQMIAGDKEALQQFALIADDVSTMVELHQILEAMRVKRGALNFDTQEAKILVNDKGMPVDVVLRQRGVAERMIESFMLAANECVAEHFSRAGLPFIYRVHEEPKAEKLQTFIDYASAFGIQIQGTANKISQEALQAFMAKVEGSPGAEVLNMMLLRSMQQARYSEHNHGHYGLAADYYTHFTSPIRRYPDLLVHRMIREYNQITQEKVDHFAQVIPELAASSSQLERRAVDAERVVEAMKKAEYMADYIGDVFDGVIASVVKFGMFVELPNTIEGLVHITNLPEYYHYNERTLSLKGERSGKVFRAGQPIRVRLVRADKETGDIDFDYLASDYDVIEKTTKSVKSRRQSRQRAASRVSRSKESKPSKPKSKQKTRKKAKKPFYQKAAKKKGRKRS